MSGRKLSGICGLVAALALAGCKSASPPPPPPPPPPAPGPPADCEATATIILWMNGADYRATVVGNIGDVSEEKNLYLDAGKLTPGQSGICWLVRRLPPADTADVLWIHLKNFAPPGVVTGNGQFDPNSNPRGRLVYAQAPPYSQIDFPLGSGQKIDGARLTYEVWVKLKDATPPFLADPDIIIQKPGR